MALSHSDGRATRRRAPADRDASDTETELLRRNEDDGGVWSSDDGAEAAEVPAPAETFIITKHVMLRLLGAVYAFAFLGAYLQNGALLGDDGLMPARPHFERLQQLSLIHI